MNKILFLMVATLIVSSFPDENLPPEYNYFQIARNFYPPMDVPDICGPEFKVCDAPIHWRFQWDKEE